jgi:hypothetical protein
MEQANINDIKVRYPDECTTIDSTALSIDMRNNTIYITPQ